MSYLLDTNVVVAIINDRPAPVRLRLRRAWGRHVPILLSTVSLSELWYGVFHSQRQEGNSAHLREFLAGEIQVIPFDGEDARLSGEIRADLARRGTPIGPYDLLIAAQALRLGATVVTANTAEFTRVPGIHLQDWTR